MIVLRKLAAFEIVARLALNGAYFLVSTVAMTSSSGFAADVTFNIQYIAEANPFPPIAGSNFAWADVWAENGYAYVGSDRGICSGACDPGEGPRGVSVFSISNAGVPTYIPKSQFAVDPPDPAVPIVPTPPFVQTTYKGNEMEDIEVYDGLGFFGSDVNGSAGRTGVDIVDLSIPAIPEYLSRVDGTSCLSGMSGAVNCAHAKVHTLSVQQTAGERYLYTSDNETTSIKITNVTDENAPVFVKNLQLPGVGSNVDTHEVAVRNNRLYAASKDPSGTEGWTHIYDVSNPLNPQLMTSIQTGSRTHTAMPSYDGKTLIVAQERQGGEVRIYDISMIDQPNDPNPPILRKTLTANSAVSTANVCRFANGDNDCTDAGEQPIDAFSPHHVHPYGNLLFITWYNAGLQVFNIVDPANPVYVGAFDTWSGTSNNFDGNWGVDLSLGLNRVLLSDRKRGLIVVDASGVVISGDYNQDMKVDADDYTLWRNTFGSTRVSQHDPPLADGSRDGTVNAADYVVWRKNVGRTGPSGSGAGSGEFVAIVPEPATIVLIGVAAGVGLMISRRRFRVA